MNLSKDQLAAFIERIERLEEEKKTYADDIRDVYAEAKSAGFDVAAVRAIVRRRKDPEKAAELEAIIDAYIASLGWDKTPLGSVNGEGAMVQ